MEWSCDSSYLAVKCDSLPQSVFIYDIGTLLLHTVLTHLNQVKSFKFAPHAQQLVIGTGQSRVFVWTAAGACVIPLPNYMDV